MTRREFLGTTVRGAVALAAWRAVGGALAQEPPPPVRVGLARADHLYLPGPVYAPPGVYPEGKLDWQVVDFLTKGALSAAGLSLPLNVFSPADRVAVMIDVAPPALPLIMVEAVLEQLVAGGVAPSRIIIFSAKESDLFAAGFSLNGDGGSGVRVYGADTLGYRGGYSRVVLDQCDKLVNLARLRPSGQLGLTGALVNCLNAVDATTRFGMLAQPEELGSLLTRHVLAGKLAFHLLDCTHLDYAVPPPPTEGETPSAKPRWEYRGLLCSRDPVALDTVGAQILAAKRAAVKGEPWPLEPTPSYLECASRKWRVGQSDPAQISVRLIGDRTDLLIAAE